ncbi:MAG: alpha/beta fold hydrolase [Bacteroidota bacterium]
MFVFLIIVASALGIYLITIAFFYFIQERFIFVPNLIKKDPSIKLVSEFEDVYLQGEENGELHGMYIKVSNPKGLILYMHGNTGSLYKWSVLAEELTHYGYNVLAMDYRGYGKSTGVRNEKVMHSDAQLFYDFAKNHFDEKDIVIYGRSLGSGFATPLAKDNTPKALILETPYDNFKNVADTYFPFIPNKWLLRYEFKNDDSIQDVKCPILILHGTRDRVVPFRLAVNLYENIAEDVKNQLVTIPRGRHNNLASYALFREKVSEFLE